jgi:two-component system NtrC family sensor kinase
MNKSKVKKITDYPAFFRKRFFTIIISSISPMILVSGIILYQFNISHHEKVHAHLAELVLKHRQNIDGFLVEKLADIRVLAKTFGFDELSDEVFLQDRLEILQKGYGPVFVDLGVINSKGLQVAYAGPFKLGKAVYSMAGWFETAMKKEHVISDVFLGLRGLPHFIVTVRDTWKGEPWIIRATIDFVAFNNLVGNIRVGETGFAFILNRAGALQTKPLFDIIPEKGPYLEFMGIELEKKDDVQIVEREDESGQKAIYVAAFLKEGNWLLVYQQKFSDAFSDFHRALKVAFAIIILGGIAITIVAYMLSTRMAYRLARMDKERQMMDEQIVETGKLASVGELAAGIAHEINNPVAIMVEEAGWIEDLLEEEDFKEGKNLDEFQRSLNQIRTQGKRCKEITYKLLSFARKTDSTVQEVHLNDMLEELMAISAQRARYSNVTINTHFQSHLPFLEVSLSELQQVFLNLINNALDAMEKSGGSLDISSRLEEEHVVVTVEDNGPGIPKANLGRIFDPFFTTKQVGKGTGLGLSICYGIIKKMGGEIEVRSTVDIGTTFYVRIPLTKKSEKEQQEAIIATT